MVISSKSSPLHQLRQFFVSRFALNDNALWRVMGLLKPYRKQIIAANFFLIVASGLGGIALVSFLPLLRQTLENERFQKPGKTSKKHPRNKDFGGGLDIAFSSETATSHTLGSANSTSATLVAEAATSATSTSAGKPSNKEAMRDKLVGIAREWDWLRNTEDWGREQEHRFKAWMDASLYRFVFLYILFILVLYILAGITKFIGDYLMAKVSILVSTGLMRRVYANILRQEMMFFDHNTSGTLLNTCYREIYQMQKLIPLLASRRALLPVQMLISFVALLAISPKLCLLLVLLLPIIVLPTMFITRRLRKSAGEEVEEETGALDVMSQGLHGIQAIKAFGAEELEGEQLDPAIRKQIQNSRRRRMIISIVEPLVDLLNMIVLLVVFLVALFVFPEMFANDQSSIMLFMLGITRFYKPMRTIMTMNVQMHRAQAVARHIFHLLDRKPLIGDQPDAAPFPANWRQLRFEGVELIYTVPGRRGKLTERDALRGLNIAIERGQTVALIGPNGVGKSSIVKLICRLYDPTAGAIRFDQTPLSQIRLRELRDQVCLITQHPVLFNRPVAENIKFGLPDVTQEQIESAARNVRAHEFISRMPHGYDSLIGESGKLLSGGERQKVVLARAFVRHPSLLIFDEPTAGLDRESVGELLDLVVNLRNQGMTIIWITHEHEHLQIADRVLELMPDKTIFEHPWPPAAQASL